MLNLQLLVIHSNMATNIDRLLSQLNSTGLQNKDIPLYQVIAQLIRQVKLINEALATIGGGSGGGGTNITNITNRIYQIGSSEDSGGDGDGGAGPPGAKGADGAAGATGATGAQGPPFPAFIQLEADPPEDPLVIPGSRGAQGATGATGATGPAGPRTMGPMYVDETIVEEIIYQMPTLGRTGGGGSRWEHVDSISLGGNADWEVFDIGSYYELLVIGHNITKSVSSTSAIRVSDDNGSSYFSTSGDYVNFLASGAISNADHIQTHATAASVARSWCVHFAAWNADATAGNVPRFCFTSNVTGNSPSILIDTFNTLNALKVYNTTETGVMNAGDIWVLGR